MAVQYKGWHVRCARACMRSTSHGNEASAWQLRVPRGSGIRREHKQCRQTRANMINYFHRGGQLDQHTHTHTHTACYCNDSGIYSRHMCLEAKRLLLSHGCAGIREHAWQHVLSRSRCSQALAWRADGDIARAARIAHLNHVQVGCGQMASTLMGPLQK